MASKIVLITGSASGVGLHLTSRFSLAGYRVVATDVNFQGLKAAAAEQGWSKDNVWLRKLDITQKTQWTKLWSDLMAKWGRVDIACNVAGYLKPGMVSESELEQIDRHIDINVKGLMYGSQFAAAQMVSQGAGHIINIASLAGVAPIPGIALYSASKFAVRGFSLALAQELKPQNVAVSVICPDAIETPMLTLQEDYDEAALTFSGSKTLTVEDIGELVFKRVLPDQPLELMLPRHRGWLAKMAGVIPNLSIVMSEHLRKLGREKQTERKRAAKR